MPLRLGMIRSNKTGTARNTMLLGKDSHVEVAPYDDVRALFDDIEIKKSPLP